jgi:hypothetical protein
MNRQSNRIERRHFRSQREQWFLEYQERLKCGVKFEGDPTPEQVEKFVRYPRLIFVKSKKD